MKRLNSIYIRYLFIFLLFAGLLLVFFVPIYSYVTDFTLNNELSSIRGRLEQGIASLNSIFYTIDLIPSNHSQDTRFSVIKPWSLNPPDRQTLDFNFAVLLALRDTINLTFLPFNIDIDAVLLFPDGTAVTKRGIYCNPNVVRFYGPMLQCGDLAFDDWRSLLTPTGSLIPAMPYTSAYYPAHDAITFSTSWAYRGYPHEMIFFAVLPVDGIVSLLVDTDVAGAAYVRMYNAQGILLFSRGSDTDAKFHVIRSRSPAYSILYEIGVPDSYITAKLRSLRNLIFLFACILFGVAITASFVFAWRGSAPVRSSLQTIEAQTAMLRAQTIDRIRVVLLSGDNSTAQIVLRDCYASMPKPEVPMIAGLLAGMVNTMLHDLGEELSGILPVDEIPAFQLPEYVSGGQEELFTKHYPDCFTGICESVHAYREGNMPAKGREVLAFINKHLYDPDFYIIMVADHFNISTKTLQKLVKQCTGLTFQNYVEKHRMDKVCELLSTSVDSITQIAFACGFSSVNSFYHSFKRIYGYPPSRVQRSR